MLEDFARGHETFKVELTIHNVEDRTCATELMRVFGIDDNKQTPKETESGVAWVCNDDHQDLKNLSITCFYEAR